MAADQGCLYARCCGIRRAGLTRPSRRICTWQKRFWEHTVRDERDFERCADYIHFNPVKHRLVLSPAAWPFSSLHRYVRTGVLTRDWGGGGLADNANFGERGD